MSNYPDGVTGNEPQIAGFPEREDRAEMECGSCDFVGEVEVTEYITHRGRDEIIGGREWTCPSCGEEHFEDNIVLAERDDPDEGESDL